MMAGSRDSPNPTSPTSLRNCGACVTLDLFFLFFFSTPEADISLWTGSRKHACSSYSSKEGQSLKTLKPSSKKTCLHGTAPETPPGACQSNAGSPLVSPSRQL